MLVGKALMDDPNFATKFKDWQGGGNQAVGTFGKPTRATSSATSGPINAHDFFNRGPMQRDPATGLPQMAAFNPLIDADTGLLKQPLQSNYNSVMGGVNSRMPTLNTQGLEAYRSQALRTGPSQWAGLQNRNLALQEQEARQAAAAESGQAGAQTRQALAMRGGLTSGAAERAARAGGLGLLQAQQGIQRQGMANRLNLGIEDERMRQDMLGKLPGLETQAHAAGLDAARTWGTLAQGDENARLGNQQWNIQNSLGEYQARRNQDLKEYEERMKAHIGGAMSAAEAARAEEAKKGGIMGTGGLLNNDYVNFSSPEHAFRTISGLQTNAALLDKVGVKTGGSHGGLGVQIGGWKF